MTFPTFTMLFDEALNKYTERELFIAERGWQSWMETLDCDTIVNYLDLIWELSKMTYKDLRKELGYSRLEMARQYVIPSRTLENWDAEVRMPPPYLRNMIYYCVFIQLIEPA